MKRTWKTGRRGRPREENNLIAASRWKKPVVDLEYGSYGRDVPLGSP